MTKTGWIIFAVAVILGLGSLVVWTRAANPPLDVSEVNSAVVLEASEASGNIADRVMGNTESKIVLIEYGDFQCPGCAGASLYVQTLMEEYKDDIAFVFRNFPNTSGFPNAKAAAAAAEAAGNQGKYWEMNSHLFQAQSEWASADIATRTDIFVRYAESLQLDAEKFKTDLASKEIDDKIRFDRALGAKDEVTGTPSFYLNGEKVSDETANGIINGRLDDIKKEIDALL